MNSELCKKALEKVGNPSVLVNLVSRRVRQLNGGIGPLSRPLVDDAQNMNTEDVALREIIEGKITYELPEELPGGTPTKRKRRKRGG